MKDKLGSIKFMSYEKIAESLRQLQIDDAGYRQLEKTDWVVTEKVHGANFCFVTDGQEIKCAKRKGFLERGENFFGYENLLEKLNYKIKQAFFLIQEQYPEICRIFIYGELFGGGYPHPDVEPNEFFNPVQTGVYYCPSIEFYAFDIAIESDEGSNVNRVYLNFDRALDIFQKIGIFHAAPLLIGKLNEAWEYPIGFDSTIPALLGLPKLPSRNPAEGIVIKPVISMEVETPKGRIRPILKKKIPEFAEDRRFHQSEKWTEQPMVMDSDRLTLLKWEVYNLVTENRLHNAISKIGQLENSDRTQSRKLFRVFVEDILEQIHENQSEIFNSITRLEKDELLEYLYTETRGLFKKVLSSKKWSSS